MPGCDQATRHAERYRNSSHAWRKREKRELIECDEVDNFDDMREALEEVDHVCVWPEHGREPGTAYDRAHFRMVQGNRILGDRTVPRHGFFVCERDPRLARRRRTDGCTWAQVARVRA